MYQLIEKLYVGIDQDMARHSDADRIEIKRLPFDEEDVLNDTGHYRLLDWSVTVYGCYPSLAEATAAVKTVFGEVRTLDPRGNAFESTDAEVVAVFKPGKYYPVGLQGTQNIMAETIAKDVNAFTTDNEIDELLVAYHGFSNRNGFVFHRALRDMMIKQREQHQAEFVVPDPVFMLSSYVRH